MAFYYRTDVGKLPFDDEADDPPAVEAFKSFTLNPCLLPLKLLAAIDDDNPANKGIALYYRIDVGKLPFDDEADDPPAVKAFKSFTLNPCLLPLKLLAAVDDDNPVSKGVGFGGQPKKAATSVKPAS